VATTLLYVLLFMFFVLCDNVFISLLMCVCRSIIKGYLLTYLLSDNDGCVDRATKRRLAAACGLHYNTAVPSCYWRQNRRRAEMHIMHFVLLCSQRYALSKCLWEATASGDWRRWHAVLSETWAPAKKRGYSEPFLPVSCNSGSCRR